MTKTLEIPMFITRSFLAATLAATLVACGQQESGSQGCLAPGPHNTPHAGPHGAFPSDWKGHP